MEDELVDVSPERLQHRSKAGKPSDESPVESCFDAEHTIFQSLDKVFMESLRVAVVVAVVDDVVLAVD